VPADDDVDARTAWAALRPRRAVPPSLPFATPPWLRAMTTSTSRLAQDLHHSLADSTGSGISPRPRWCRSVPPAEHTEEAEAQAAAFDHEVAADQPVLGQLLETGQRRVACREIGVRRGTAGIRPPCPPRDRLAQAIGPEVEFMVAEGGGVVTMRAMSCSSPPISRLAAAKAVPMLKSPASSISTGPWLSRPSSGSRSSRPGARSRPVVSSLSVNGV